MIPTLAENSQCDPEASEIEESRDCVRALDDPMVVVAPSGKNRHAALVCRIQSDEGGQALSVTIVVIPIASRISCRREIATVW